MKGLVVDAAATGTPRLVVADVPEPQPQHDELLVRVAVAGMNRADLALTADHHAGHGVVGSELAGEVVQVGPGCAGFSVGDRIMALSRASHAELACVDHRLAVHLPPDMSWQLAGALPAWYMTAHDALVTQGGLKAGEAVLVQGVTSGVGQAAAQLAKVLGARAVVGVSRSRHKLDQLTAAEVDNRLVMEPDWPRMAREVTGGSGVDLLIDMVGGGALQGNLESMALCGRMVAVGRLGGARDTLDIGMLAFKRLRIAGVTFRSRSLEEKAAIAKAFAAEVLPHVGAGRLRPRIDCVVPLGEAAAAQDMMRSDRHFGKVLLAIR